jgi:HPt (histidine-containing phosphotransfer) domain-containing protein
MGQEEANRFKAADEALPARNEGAALAAVGGDAALAEELFAILLEGLPGDLERLRLSCRNRNWSEVAGIAHRMRGGTGYCGVPALSEALRKLEQAAIKGEVAGVQQRLDQVENETDRLLGNR